MEQDSASGWHASGTERIPAVILAAGAGTRLSCDNRAAPPKPLTPLLGLALLERTILTMREAGVKEFFVVLGHRAEEIRPRLAEWAEKYGVSITSVENPDWEKGNGSSALACAGYLNRPFLLAMSDHLFEPAAVRRLIERGKNDSFCYLLVDRRLERIFDPPDATRVRSVDGKIIEIGKGLSRYNAIDTGFFLCSPILFPALREAAAAGEWSLSGGMRRLAVAGRLRAVEIGDLFWFDVDTPAALREARRKLLRGIAKPTEDGFVSHFLNRPVSTRISAFLVEHRPFRKLSPNAISVLSFAVVLLGAALFVLPGYISTLLAGVLVQLGSVIDGCDGEVARLTHRMSRFGAWLDTILDRYGDLGVATGITYGAWVRYRSPWVWLGGILAMSGFLLSSYTKKEYALRYGKELRAGRLSRLIKRDLRLFAIFLGAICNAPYFALIGMGLLSHYGVFRLFCVEKRSK